MSQEVITANSSEIKPLNQAPSLERAFLTLKDTLDQKAVSGSDIDAITPLDFRISGGTKGPERYHLLLAIDSDDMRDRVWYSPAPVTSEDGGRPLCIVTKPGLCEITEDGIGWEFHKEIGNRNPKATMLTHATEGVGPTAQHCDMNKLYRYGINHMSERGLWLLRTYFNNDRIATVGTSMGTVILHNLLMQNRLELPENQLEIVGNVNFAPALVDKRNIVTDMLIKFIPYMIIDGAAEVIVKTEPKRVIKQTVSFIKSKFGIRDAVPIGRQTFDLLMGIYEDEVRANAEYYRTATIVGEYDPVGQIKMWRRLGELITLYEIKNRGHAIAVKPTPGAQKVTQALEELGVYDDDPYTLAEAA